jgi:phosphoadenosine phosphosulfate reductase
MNAPILWQRLRPSGEPVTYAARYAALNVLLTWIRERHSSVAFASSLSADDIVLTHALVTANASVDVFVIDTGRLHRQTLDLVPALEQRLGIRLELVQPDPQAVANLVAEHGLFGFYDSVGVRKACCHLRKVEPLERALTGRDAWLTGQRRAHGPERAGLAIEEHDAARGIAKYNPLALWSDADIWHHIDRHQLPVNPLHSKGYPSIGCEPCTRAIRADEDPRAGRWWWENGSTKECGLHSPHSAVVSSKANVSAANVKPTQSANALAKPEIA